jgi:DNA (cytosine-5)-methyltransferase 1
MPNLKYFSMFSGIGGFERGIKQAGANAECVGYSEIDKYAIKVYERNFNGDNRPNIRNGTEEIQENSTDIKKRKDRAASGHKNWGDATTIKAEELPDFDLLVGGFPCQAFSIAGKRAGFNDTRGTLFFDIARILAEKRPRHLVLENVKGLLSHDSGKTFQTILGVLSDLGYRVEWQVLNSKDFGVPQNRERIYFIGHLRNECRGKVFPIAGNGGKTNELPRHVSNTLTARGAQAVGTYIGESELNAQEIQQLNQPTHSNDRVYGTDGVSPTLNTMQGGNRQPFIAEDVRIRRLTPIECERLQGFPDQWTAQGTDGAISDTQRYKMCGNAVTVNVVEAVMKGLLNHA